MQIGIADVLILSSSDTTQNQFQSVDADWDIRTVLLTARSE